MSLLSDNFFLFFSRFFLFFFLFLVVRVQMKKMTGVCICEIVCICVCIVQLKERLWRKSHLFCQLILQFLL